MARGILQTDVAHRGIVLDPRTKLFALLTIAMFALGGFGGPSVSRLLPVICMIPFGLLISAGKIQQAVIGLVIYIGAGLLSIYVLPLLSGFFKFLLLGSCGILTRFFPGILMGAYLMGTTTVSEFNAAMHRMHISETISIPLSVMFRFFPTVFEEAASIRTAMRMRNIRIGGSNFGKMLEYRLVPLMLCSVKIGEELSAAALTRGLGGDVKRTNICEIGFRFQDMVVMLICLAPWAVMIISYFGFFV